MVRATLIEVGSDDATGGRGEFDFVQLPSKDDKVVIPNNSMGIDIFRVLHLEHHPIEPGGNEFKKEPCVLLFLKWIDSED